MPFLCLWLGKGKKEAPAKALDPVCDMEVDPGTAPATCEYKGQTYYFCAPGCQRAFVKDPEKYLAGHRVKMCPGP